MTEDAAKYFAIFNATSSRFSKYWRKARNRGTARPLQTILGKTMKILISYDGSGCSEAAIDDLVIAGLPAEGEAIVISVAEVWLPPPNVEDNDPETDALYREHCQKASGTWGSVSG